MAGKLRDHTGKRFGRLTCLSFLDRRDGKTFWRVRCDCGNEDEARADVLMRGHKQSCGCLATETARAILTTHGHSRVPEYAHYISMIRRCTEESNPSYPRYGGRGVTICERWLSSFEDFLADMGPRPTPDHTLDRDDANGNYEPGKVKWSTPQRQARNKRNSVFVEFRGVRMPLMDACDIVGADSRIVRQRINRYGWTLERALGL